MKNLSTVINAVLIVAVGVLFFLHFSDGDKAEMKSIAGDGTVVYVNTDSLLSNYNFSVDLNEKFLKKQEDSKTNFNFKAQKLEKEAAEFQRKIQNNGYLNRDRAEKAQRDLLAKKQNLDQLDRKLSAELMAEQNENSKRLFDSVTNYLKLYNTKHKFSMIISTTKGGTVLYSADGLDITKDIIDGLNARYKK
ncbi:OmpH family outer membrane protein [Ancylomarina sp. 16SWW S1-10-2]|uniref:OmpH family outer membrane protein n=1 Tax=Ancylomarina sp. 16SWW S1-10-2 TaxID=2499681 RepID=UPI0012AEB0B0|nr:OmpH family outer membrane protein [Ancylomarina sp. 16SWW S1-10-2]MRT91394.1 OmpH family outer membrane protein [Ancylomarina sp. 16SWW S1-10-2]